MFHVVLQEIFHGVSGRFPEASDRLLQVDEALERRAPRIPVEEYVDLRFPPFGRLTGAAREVARGAWAVVVVARPATSVGRCRPAAVRTWPAHELARGAVPRVPADRSSEAPLMLSGVVALGRNSMENKALVISGSPLCVGFLWCIHRFLVLSEFALGCRVTAQRSGRKLSP